LAKSSIKWDWQHTSAPNEERPATGMNTVPRRYRKDPVQALKQAAWKY